MSFYDLGHPYTEKVEAGKTVYICQCGKSKSPPYCDGSHKGTGIEPLAHTPDADGSIYVCGCGKSAKMPFCDGSHNK